MLEGGKPENPEKTLRGKARTKKKKTHTHMALSQNQTHGTLVGGECSQVIQSMYDNNNICIHCFKQTLHV